VSEYQPPGAQSDDVLNLKREQASDYYGEEITATLTLTRQGWLDLYHQLVDGGWYDVPNLYEPDVAADPVWAVKRTLEVMD
jgi:hypothetical protein